MATRSLIEPTPWDAAALGVDSYELRQAGAAAMMQMRQAPGLPYAVGPAVAVRDRDDCEPAGLKQVKVRLDDPGPVVGLEVLCKAERYSDVESSQ